VKKHQEAKDIEAGNDNIFADIGIENSGEELTKAELAWEIEQILKKKKMTQAKAAKLMGITQPKVSALLHRKLAGFSVERLIHLLTMLGQDIDIVVKPKPRRRRKARISVYGSQECFSCGIPMVAKSY
jgi:predicted XRE-type DNA-binding protein